MKEKVTISTVLLVALFLTIAPTILASTTWYVDGVHGNDNNNCKSPTTACKTIGHAIALASSGDSIRVAAATYTENLTIGISLNVIGSGASTTSIDARGFKTVVKISTPAVVTLSGLAITNGNAINGGGILNGGTLTINNSTISGNRAYWQVCPLAKICSAFGGGIYNSGTLTISNSTLADNSALVYCNNTHRCSSCGGAIFNAGKMIMSNSTVTRNTSFVNPGDLYARGGGGICDEGTSLTVTNSTFDGNRAGLYGGGIVTFGSVAISNSTLSSNGAGSGGDIANFGGTVALQNSIVANSTSGGNCYSTGTITSHGYNLSSDNTCNFNNSGDWNSTDPLLGPLQSNGGPTQTMALQPGSPAIDAGNPHGCKDSQGNLLKTDQRGYPRHDPEDTGGCDIGAYERQGD